MCRLIDVVQSGGRPDVMPPTIMPRPGEVQHGSMSVELSQFYGTTVEYSTGGYGFGGGLMFVAAGMAAGAIRDANRKRRADAESAPQWRPKGRVPAVLTSRRLVLMIDGHWASYYLDALVSMQPDVANWAVVLHFEQSAPLLLRGPWVPWSVVVVSAVMFGQPWPPGSPPPVPLRARPVLPQQPVQPAPQPAPVQRMALPPGPTPPQDPDG
jgi:hypothetical protein